jgi:hypothetical protein
VDVPSFSTWEYYIKRKWAPEGAPDMRDLIGFALVLESYGKSGASIYPSAKRLAERLRVSEKTIKRQRALCVKLGIFRVVGHFGRIPILERCMPAETVVDVASAATVPAPVPTAPSADGLCQYCGKPDHMGNCEGKWQAFKLAHPEDFAA